ncbi:hypothetical protein [Haloplanus vescus]|uniref:hypothetical protein n=1 Tax=Haloplanus vescus TaxID=555874 RepID=UPI00115F9B70|nr:hypothetical protein [Haloplanus vescus]
MEPDDWVIGVIRSDDEYSVLTQSGHVDPSSISEVVFPLSFPWDDEPQLIPVPLEVVEVNERNMGPERHYSARAEGTVPNSNDFWEIEIELWEYPSNTFNMSSLTHTDNIRSALWDEDDLLNAIRTRF